jgi:Outer membrane protein beta-barrel domain
MRKHWLNVFLLIAAFFAVPAWAQESANTFNLHIGGGIGVPLNPTSNFAGVSGTFQVGAGPNLTKHQSLIGEFMWHGLPPNRIALAALANLQCVQNLPTAPATTCDLHTGRNLYTLTADYMFHWEHARYGYYAIAGGGWYYRYGQLKNATVAPGTVCAPIWNWWGFTCQNGFVSTDNTLASRGLSSGGVNAGFGLTIKLAEPPTVKFYIEARYHYSPQGGRVSTQVIPVTMGIRF